MKLFITKANNLAYDINLDNFRYVIIHKSTVLHIISRIRIKKVL